MSRVLLINPKIDTHIISPHLGLGYLSAALKKRGHEVVVQDGLREEIVLPEDSSEYDFVGVTSTTTSFPTAVKLVKKIVSVGIPCVIGGSHVTVLPEESLLQSGADFALVGEGEISLPMLVEGENHHEIPGLYWRKNGEILHEKNSPRIFIEDLDEFDSPDWTSISPSSYPLAPHGMIVKKEPVAPIITTRGCPYNCSYCGASIISGKRIRYRTPSKVVDEIEMLINQYGVKEIQIEDDNFTFDINHAMNFCKEIIARNIKIDWSLPNGVRADRLTDELIGLIKNPTAIIWDSA